MEIFISNTDLNQFDCDSLVVFGFAPASEKSSASYKSEHSEAASFFKKSIDDEVTTGKFKEARLFRYALNENSQDLLAVGCGSKKDLTAERLRQIAPAVGRTLAANSVNSVTVDFKSLQLKGDLGKYVSAFIEGLQLSGYKFDKISEKEKESVDLETVEIYGIPKNKTHQKAIDDGVKTAKWVNYARHLGDTPGNYMTPTLLAESVKENAKGTGLKVTIWDKARLEKEKMGGILGVAQGSAQEPRLIIMEYNGAAKSKKPACFVGKGLTFDAGGISIKPSAKMDEMKYDMCGGANVIGTMLAIADLGLKVNVMGIVASSENLLGAAAVKPGDVLKFRNGKTAEILNTDAEGRLILADALSYASEKKPAFICDAATLTGAMIVALGNIYTGYFARDKKLKDKIEKASGLSGEKVWNMPLDPEHTKDLQSPFADLQNIGKTGGAGSATAAAFLSEFVEESIPWAHFDVAGTAWDAGSRLSYNPKRGATGAIIRTFIELAKLN